MTPHEQMIAILYKAISEGVAKLIKNGLAFTVMSLAIIGLILAIVEIDARNKEFLRDVKNDMLAMKIDHSSQLNDLRREIDNCNAARERQALEIVELRVILKKIKTY